MLMFPCQNDPWEEHLGDHKRWQFSQSGWVWQDFGGPEPFYRNLGFRKYLSSCFRRPIWNSEIAWLLPSEISARHVHYTIRRHFSSYWTVWRPAFPTLHVALYPLHFGQKRRNIDKVLRHLALPYRTRKEKGPSISAETYDFLPLKSGSCKRGRRSPGFRENLVLDTVINWCVSREEKAHIAGALALICSDVRDWGLNFHLFWCRWRCITIYLRFQGKSWQHPSRIGSYIYLRLLFLAGRGPTFFLSMNASIFSFITWLEKKVVWTKKFARFSYVLTVFII